MVADPFLPAAPPAATRVLAGVAVARDDAVRLAAAGARLVADFTRGFTPDVDAFTIRAVAALAAAFLDAERFATDSEETALTTLREPFVLVDVFDFATFALALAVLEFFCANAQSACAAPVSNTAPTNNLDIQFTAPISAKTSH